MSTTDDATGCPECGAQIIHRNDEHVCSSCGLVTGSDRLDRGPEWRGSPRERQQRRRTGAPLTRARHDRGLSTEIGYTSGADVGASNPHRLARMRREHNRAQIRTKAERNRVYGFTEIRRICSSLELSHSIRERSCVVFEQAQEADLFKGRSLEGFAAAAVYAVCRIERVGRTRQEVIEVARADEAELNVAYDAINRDLGLPIAPLDPRAYLPRLASMLEVPSGVEHTARGYADWLMQEGLAAGRKPGGVAGACLYVAAGDRDVNLSQREVANAADVSPVTVRGVSRLLDEHDLTTYDEDLIDHLNN